MTSSVYSGPGTLNVSYEEISASTWVEESVAPNGSARSADYWTAVVSRQTWANDPANGIYAGRCYKITDLYISGTPEVRGQSAGSSSRPWTD